VPPRAEVLASIAANVRSARQERGWSQAELAERAELELRQLQRIEAADIDFGVTKLVAIADAFGIPADALLLAQRLPNPVKGRPRRRPKPQPPER